ncbi:MAG: DUF4386 domain-containing protein [Ignavibacteriales bacterium]|nr:DUF4386 domain-containing protein [Ignavibacteriales bacterium]
MNSNKKTSRIIFLFWVLYAVPAIFSLQYVQPKLIVLGDAVATSNNIIGHEFLFRMGIVSHLLAQIFLLFFGMTVFHLFKGVNKTWAAIFWTSILMTVAITFINTLNFVGPLIVLSKADYLNVFQQDQLHAFVMIFLRLSNFGQALYEVFWGMYLFAFGLLIIKSSYIPRFLGVLLIIGSIGFPINTFTKLLIPEFYPALFTQMTMFFSGLGVLPTLFWILIVGLKINTQTIDKQ